MTIKHIKAKNFRSISKDIVLDLEDLKQFNLFIGKNNSGKSNIIRILPFLGDLIRRLPNLTDSFNPSADNSHSNVDDFFYKNTNEITLSITFSITDDEKKKLLAGFPGNNSTFMAELFNNQKNELSLTFILIKEGDGTALRYHFIEFQWADVVLISRKDQIMRRSNRQYLQDRFDEDYGAFSTKRSADFNYLFVMLSEVQKLYVHFRVIKAVRKIGGTSQKDDGTTFSRLTSQLDINGLRTIDHISSWSSPNNSHVILRKKYRSLNLFVSSLLGIKVEIIVQDDKTQLLLEPVNEKYGDIMSYKAWGSSVEELIVLMVDILYSPDNSIIALEEPEVHLDPFMQRRLIDFLKEETSHQFFISSHSNILINSFTSDSDNIFRVFQENGSTITEKANEEVLHHVLDDLGVKASDILQTNGIIWVEGPSDRIFINHWIHLYDKNLIEGIHYSIMFYGGKLLSHLSADVTQAEENAETDDFINLVRLNRNVAVVIDSDKKSSDDTVNATKQRIEKEIDSLSDRSMIWITDGREIENYIPSAMFKEVLSIEKMGKFTRVSKLSKNYVKVNSANKLVDKMSKEIFKDSEFLRERIATLVLTIKRWNE